MVLMVRLFWVFFFLGFGLAVSAQDDPVLMRINGKEVLRSEFERSYNKGGTSVGAGRKALDVYVNKFIDFMPENSKPIIDTPLHPFKVESLDRI
jgi:peptidyl-prolyl cis-trans isomerase SurA